MRAACTPQHAKAIQDRIGMRAIKRQPTLSKQASKQACRQACRQTGKAAGTVGGPSRELFRNTHACKRRPACMHTCPHALCLVHHAASDQGWVWRYIQLSPLQVEGRNSQPLKPVLRQISFQAFLMPPRRCHPKVEKPPCSGTYASPPARFNA